MCLSMRFLFSSSSPKQDYCFAATCIVTSDNKVNIPYEGHTYNWTFWYKVLMAVAYDLWRFIYTPIFIWNGFLDFFLSLPPLYLPYCGRYYHISFFVVVVVFVGLLYIVILFLFLEAIRYDINNINLLKTACPFDTNYTHVYWTVCKQIAVKMYRIQRERVRKKK